MQHRACAVTFHRKAHSKTMGPMFDGSNQPRPPTPTPPGVSGDTSWSRKTCLTWTVRERCGLPRRRSSARAKCVAMIKAPLIVKALCSTRFSSWAAELWMCHTVTAMPSADHVQRAAPNSPKRPPQLTPLQTGFCCIFQCVECSFIGEFPPHASASGVPRLACPRAGKRTQLAESEHVAWSVLDFGAEACLNKAEVIRPMTCLVACWRSVCSLVVLPATACHLLLNFRQ